MQIKREQQNIKTIRFIFSQNMDAAILGVAVYAKIIFVGHFQYICFGYCVENGCSLSIKACDYTMSSPSIGYL